MSFQTATFYVFSAILIFAALRVVTTRNPVHAALWLVLCFFSASGVWLLLGAEFLAITLVLVYVGAVMVLFLFVVMMLDINFAELRQGFLTYLPIGLVIGIILLVELALVFGAWIVSPLAESAARAPLPPPSSVSNTHALGLVLYTNYMYLFELAGFVLLVAMVGAIVLTLRHREGVRRQSIDRQMARRAEESLEIKNVPSGSGVSS